MDAVFPGLVVRTLPPGTNIQGLVQTIDAIDTISVFDYGSTGIDLYRNLYQKWEVGHIVLLSYAESEGIFNYIVEVTDEGDKGRGLSLVVPNSYYELTIRLKIMYRTNFKIPMLQKKESIEIFSLLWNWTLQDHGINFDCYFQLQHKNSIVYDPLFRTTDKTPLWYLLNHDTNQTRNMYLKQTVNTSNKSDTSYGWMSTKNDFTIGNRKYNDRHIKLIINYGTLADQDVRDKNNFDNNNPLLYLTWRRKEDSTLRKKMINKLMTLFNFMPDRRAEVIAKSMEKSLYLLAPTKKVYQDTNTFRERLDMVILFYGGNNRPISQWQSLKDLPLRSNMITKIMLILEGINPYRPPEWFENDMPYMAQRLEYSLYQATTKKVYQNMNTLEQRLHNVLQAYDRPRDDSSNSSSSSSSSSSSNDLSSSSNSRISPFIPIWQRKEDLPIRRNNYPNIRRVLLEINPNRSPDWLADWVPLIEDWLYNQALTQQIYNDMNIDDKKLKRGLRKALWINDMRQVGSKKRKESGPSIPPKKKRPKHYITLAHYNLLMHGKQFVPPHRL